MKPILFVVAVFLVTLLGALWLLGVFETSAPEPTGEGPRPGPESPTGSGDVVPLSGQEPKTEPKVDPPEIPTPVRVLVLGDSVRSFSEWMIQLWDFAPRIEWQAWYVTAPPPSQRTHVETLPPVERTPTVADLEGVQVLVVAAMDPAAVPAPFWARVAERVRQGSLGLLLLPDHRFGLAMAQEPSLREILPVVGVKPVAAATPGSSEIPGVFASPRPFEVTEEGVKHPATRLVPFTGWSGKIWASTAKGASAWTSPFCYPVEGPALGALVLLNVDAGTSKMPAVVASAGKEGRVLWVGGFFDLTRPAYTDGTSVDRMRALTISWIAWLSAPRT